MRNIYQACRYHNKPAIFDTITHVYYFGFKTMKQARERAEQLNNGQ